MYKFSAEDTAKKCIEWIRNWFEVNGKGCKAVIGISGGKDSTVTAALLVEALGKENVIGVIMPNGEQLDLDVAIDVCNYLCIKHITVNIKEAFNAIKYQLIKEGIEPSSQTKQNLPPRLRMSTLYAVSQSVNGRVVNTCNLSEDYVGYSTRYGDSVGDFSPLSLLTVTEVKAIGRYLNLPERFIEKVPSDGLCGKTDEDNLGFTYAELDAFIREGIEPSKDKLNRIKTLHEKNLFKLRLMDVFDPEIK